MASSILASARAEPAPPSRARRTRGLAIGGAVFVALLIVAALAAPVIAPADPLRQSLRGRLAAPAVSGPSFPTLIVLIWLSGWVTYARVLRSQVLVLRSREFVDAIHALGGSVARVIARHVLPNVLSSLVVIATLELARAIVLEATLSF